MTIRDLDWSDYEADGERAAQEAGAFRYDGKWYDSEQQWFDAQTPEVQSAYHEYMVSIMGEAAQYDPTPDHDTRGSEYHELCLAPYPDGGPFFCTRERGHAYPEVIEGELFNGDEHVDDSHLPALTSWPV